MYRRGIKLPSEDEFYINEETRARIHYEQIMELLSRFVEDFKSIKKKAKENLKLAKMEENKDEDE